MIGFTLSKESSRPANTGDGSGAPKDIPAGAGTDSD